MYLWSLIVWTDLHIPLCNTSKERGRSCSLHLWGDSSVEQMTQRGTASATVRDVLASFLSVVSESHVEVDELI